MVGCTELEGILYSSSFLLTAKPPVLNCSARFSPILLQSSSVLVCLTVTFKGCLLFCNIFDLSHNTLSFRSELSWVLILTQASLGNKVLIKEH